MQAPLARHLAGHGNHVVTLDPLGHGRSDRPRDMWRYAISAFAEEVIALLDHLDIDEAVVGGTSLGANITLDVARIAPQRLRDVRRTFTMPALIIGHQRDPVHPFSDAGMLADEMPNARLVVASNILELRLRPERLSAEISDFVAECWGPRTVARPRGRRRSA